MALLGDLVMDAIHNLISHFDKLAINIVQQQPEPQPKPAYIAERESSIMEKEIIAIIEEATTAIMTIGETEKEANLEIEIIETKVNLMTEITETDPEKENKPNLLEEQNIEEIHYDDIITLEQPEISKDTIFEERKDEEKDQIINQLEAKVNT
ncbi:12856_t:CDS:2 [Ambispora leptoticha]|uniref:12856_t:CDS:1 n=1 Tax=Ambispora leptoticha TaxID=144679 RepID=A0A9N9C8S8_9GLOM|nr:12856_t:CDS:2 [Ambispora leptoticha]